MDKKVLILGYGKCSHNNIINDIVSANLKHQKQLEDENRYLQNLRNERCIKCEYVRKMGSNTGFKFLGCSKATHRWVIEISDEECYLLVNKSKGGISE
jgi:hypothetical protein